MGTAERVSRRTVTSAAQAAIDRVHECIEALNAQADKVSGHSNVLDRVIKAQKHDRDHADVQLKAHTGRIDAHGGMILALEEQTQALRVTQGESFKEMAEHFERRLTAVARARVEREDGILKSLHDGHIVFVNVGFFGRLRWLLTGRVA